jgi:hypothetical protein
MTTVALEDIDDIDWASLNHAYGSAEDVPQTLRDAVGADEEVADEAIGHLYGSIYHQGTLYTATPWAVPFVAELAADPRTPRRVHLVNLLGAIAASDDAKPEVLADVRTALARETTRLVPLLDDPDVDVRHLATRLLGNLPQSEAAEVVPALRARRERERSPRVLAGLLAAVGRLAPSDNAEWLTGELAPGRPAAARAGALWAIADAGLPWSDAATEAVVDLWLNGDPLTSWIWADDPFADIVARIDSAPFADLCRTLFERGTADTARNAIDAVYQRCVRSRSARDDFAPLLAAGIDHPDIGVRFAAATAVRDVPAAAPLAADSLAAFVTDPCAEDANSLEARLFGMALEILIALGDPRWRAPFTTALVAGRLTSDVPAMLIDTDVPCDPVLLTAVRERLAALPPEWSTERGGYDAMQGRMLWHNEISTLTRLLHHWGPDAAEAVPELVRLVPHDQWWAVRALAAIGLAASAAVPVLTQVRDDPTAAWPHRLDCAQALTALTGDIGQLSACIAEATAAGEPVPAARMALHHGLPLNGAVPALRDIATTATADEPAAIRVRLQAARLLLQTGDTTAPLSAAADALDSRRYTADAAELAGLMGPAATELVPRLRTLLDDQHQFHAAALAIRRVTGEPEPLVAAVRRRLPTFGAGPWLMESLRELAADAAPLLPTLRDLVDNDAAIPGLGIDGRQVQRDEEQRRQLVAVLDELQN